MKKKHFPRTDSFVVGMDCMLVKIMCELDTTFELPLFGQAGADLGAGGCSTLQGQLFLGSLFLRR